jgi:thiol-disulfide isomerase/thioredoxin
MDRLHLVIAAALLFGMACDDKPKKDDTPATTPSRVNAVVAKKQAAEAPADFCDVYHADASAAAKFEYPELTADPPASGAGWRWVNVWATWCKPCVEEMPRLATWETALKGDGLGGIVFLSADDSDEIVTKFRAEHSEVPESVRMTSADALQPWLNGLGLQGSPSLPVHIFVDGSGAARCVRMGGVTDNDRGAVERVISGT